MIAISAKDIRMEYGIDVVLNGVSFSVETGEKIGLIGSNGAGKSTLFHILTGEAEPSGGTVSIGQGLRLGFLRQERDDPHSALSGGEQARAKLDALLSELPDILLLDEPTNHLDLRMLGWLERCVKGFPGTVLLVSHDRYFLDRTVTRIFEIEDTALTAYKGNYSAYREKKRVREEADNKAFEHAMREIRRQEEMIRRFKERGTEKLAKRAASREKRLAQFKEEGLPTHHAQRQTANIRFEAAKRSGDDVLLAQNLSQRFGDRTLFEGVDLELKRGEKTCMIGENGIGKTTLLRILAGRTAGDTGLVERGANVKIGYYDQHQAELVSGRTLLEELRDLLPFETDTGLRALLGRFLFRGDKVFQTTDTLSGGEKARLSLLKLIVSGANTLLLDEPTNHLDIASMEAVETALAEFDGTLLVVSHDRWLLDLLPRRVLELTSEGLRDYPGDYEYYCEKKAAKEAETAAVSGAADGRFAAYDREFGASAVSEAEAERRHAKQAETERRRKERQLSETEARIEALEKEIKEIETALASPGNATDHLLLAKLHAAYEARCAELSALYERWESLCGA
ncbi:MAG: ABC-F family ATP-binding cassette domain-containing protein [Clostridiales bacterium]|nr:ABC-F family ATP-binding cassette domain-containing protein [Clostridiales bacterium]